ncbi:MAG TPA: hypothetical protein VFL86_03315, partial [Burkholderiaceae bacterium]|nr:hypothetical protein [Burkholderiaceae bacterium]
GGHAVAAEWHADGGVRRTFYDIFGDARQVIDEGNNVLQQHHDQLGRLTQVDRLGVTQVNSNGIRQPAITLTESFSYDALGQRLSHTNALGTTTRMDYDSLGRVVSARTAMGFETRYQYQTELVAGLNGSIATGTRKTSFQPDGRSTVDKVDYFGHTTWHSDLSGAAYTYNYDAAARLVSQSSSVHDGQRVGQSIRYTYYANGYIRSVTDETTGTTSDYGYDSDGNRVTEGYYQWDGRMRTASYQNATITYDELNRVARIIDSNYFDLRQEYDAVGNRRLVESVYWDGLAGLRDKQTYWYDYDTMNRFTVTKGTLSGSRATTRSDSGVAVVAGAEGTVLAYDPLGRRTMAQYKFNNETVVESYGYRQDGFLQTTSQGGIQKTVRVLDKAGRTVEQTDKQNNSTTVNQYDADNRLLSQVYTDGKDSNKSNRTDYKYYADATDTTSTAAGAGALASTVATQQGTTVTTTYQYDYWDDAQQKTIRKAGATIGATTLTYNPNGHLVRAYDQAANLATNYFNSANGLILKRERQQGLSRVGSHFYYYVDGKRVGDVSDDPNDDTRMSYAEALARKPQEPQDKKMLYRTFRPVTSADFDQNYEPVNDSYPGPTGSSYTAQGGESLAGVAQALWGDGSLWYLIAEANGLNGTQPLVEGQVLVIPNKVTNAHNNSSTVRPYNAGEAIGNIDPTLPAPPPPPGKDDCGAMKMVLVIVVAVAVTVVTGGAAAGALGPLLGPVLAGVVGGAIGGAAGSLAGQGLSIAMGMQDKLDWKALRQSTVNGAISGGVDASISELLKGSSTAQALLDGSKALPTAGRTFLSSSATLALQNQWNWRDVMASAV